MGILVIHDMTGVPTSTFNNDDAVLVRIIHAAKSHGPCRSKAAG